MKKPVSICVIVLSVAALFFAVWLLRAPQKGLSFHPVPAVSPQNAGRFIPSVNASENSSSLSSSPDSSSKIEEFVSMFHNGSSDNVLTGLTIRDLYNEALPLAIRRKLAWKLAKESALMDWPAIQAYLTAPDTDLRVKAVLVEALGYSVNPEARDWLVSALDCGEPMIIRAALRGLAEMDDSRNAAVFINLLTSGDSSEEVRAAAAEALGKLSSDDGGRYLMQAWNGGDTEMRELILQGLAHRNLEETADFFGQVMADSPDPDLRQAVVAAVSQASGNAAPFLLNCLDDDDSEVRAEAAWGLSLHSDGDLAAELLGRLDEEEDGTVRSHLYAALSEQSGVDAEAVSEMALREDDDEARVSACRVACTHFHDLPDAKQGKVEDLLLGELKHLAVGNGSLNVRLQAVLGIRQLGTEKAERALREIVSGSYDPRIIDATGVDFNALIGP